MRGQNNGEHITESMQCSLSRKAKTDIIKLEKYSFLKKTYYCAKLDSNKALYIRGKDGDEGQHVTLISYRRIIKIKRETSIKPSTSLRGLASSYINTSMLIKLIIDCVSTYRVGNQLERAITHSKAI